MTPRALIFFCAASLLAAQISVNGNRLPVVPPSSNTPADQRCVVSGTVVNAVSGEPLRKADVRLELQGGPPPDYGNNPKIPGYATMSAADGTFQFDGVEPGDYRLSAQRTGYLRFEHGAKKVNGAGTIMSLHRTQQITGIKLAMSPQAVVTGRVLDSDNDPIEGIAVGLLHQTWREGRIHFDQVGISQTNDLGEYRVSNVPPGQYYVLADKPRFSGMPDATSPMPGKPDVRQIRTFYPDSTRMSAGTKIQLVAGQELSNIDIRLQSSTTYHIRGKVVGTPSHGSDFSKISIRASAKGDELFWMSSTGSNLAKDHSFDLSGLAPGTYELQIFEIAGYFRPLGRQTVEVGTADVNDVAMSIVPPVTIQGQLRIEGKPPTGTTPDLSSLHINLLPGNEPTFGKIPEANIRENGTFTMEEVTLGKYRVDAPDIPGAYLSGVQFGRQDFLGKDLDLTTGAGGELEITMRYGAAELTGSIQFPDSSNNATGSPANPVGHVALISTDSRWERPHIEFASTNQDGSFSIKNVTPGTYRAYAFEEMNNSNLENPDLLAQINSLGKEVKVAENGKQQIQLTLVPADTLAGIYTRLGIENE
jgi:protocatechuate 3,4-dioxygenase beta subunit